MKVRFQPRAETKRIYFLRAADDKSSRQLNMEARAIGSLHHGYHYVVRTDGSIETGRGKLDVSSFRDKAALYVRLNKAAEFSFGTTSSAIVGDFPNVEIKTDWEEDHA